MGKAELPTERQSMGANAAPLKLTFRGRLAPAWAQFAAKGVSLLLLLGLLNHVQTGLASHGIGFAAQPMLFAAVPGGDIAAANATVPLENNTSDKRWLWWPGIVYLFWAMAHTCDVYFVRTIDVISERFSIPDDVAGATLMALGCNGPELALNTISIFHPSDIGVGAVIGGEVFNVLVIIGTALLATPASYMPLKLGLFTFTRDVMFYAISVAMLWWVLRDGVVQRIEGAVLLSGGLCYILSVIFSEKLRNLMHRLARSKRRLQRQMTHMSGLLRTKTLTRFSKADETVDGQADLSDSSSDSSEEDPEMVELWEAGVSCADPYKGSVLGVRVGFRNRLMDRTHHYDERYMCLGEDSLLLSTVTDPRASAKHSAHCASGMIYDHRGPQHHHWHHGGLVNEPVYLDTPDGSFQPSQPTSADISRPFLTPGGTARDQEYQAEWLQSPHFKDQAVEIIPLEDILYVERPRDHKHFNLHVQHHNDLGNTIGGVITLEFKSKEDIVEAWAGAFMETLIKQRRRTVGPPPERSSLSMLKEWMEWFQFPVKFWLSVTIPDMDHPQSQHLYPVSFVMSMFWLAVFAFAVIAACDGIHQDFGISTQVLGFTVAAAGTSFPNVFSGMVVAQQGKTTMAVANALGANVQNVFLALAIPWTIQACLAQGSFPLKVADLGVAIADCYITLLVVVLVFLMSSCSLPRWSGGLFLLTYAIYMVFALGQDVSHCYKWPYAC